MDRLSKRYAIARVVMARRDALEAHCGGDLSYVQRSLIKRTIWLELLVESYEQRVAAGAEVDIGAITQLNNTLKGLYKDLGIQRTARRAESLGAIMGWHEPPQAPAPEPDFEVESDREPAETADLEPAEPAEADL
ncbi:MAG: hypothetical protein ACP5P4_12260 [Steroidobacteraceae bacterium]